MRLIAVLKNGADVQAFVNQLQSVGYTASVRLTRHVFIDKEDLSLASFEFADHTDIEFLVEDTPRPIEYAADTTVVETAAMLGGWQTARVTRRQAPWHKGSLEFPINTFTRRTRTGVGVDYYMIDSGCDTSHVEYAGRVTNIGNVSSPDLDESSPVSRGHGTSSMSFVIGATCGLATGALAFYYGMQHEQDYIPPADSDYVDACAAILSHYNSRAGLNRPAVCSMSIAGVGADIPVILTAFNTLIDAGITVVFPAGNESKDLATINVTPTEGVLDAIIAAGTNIIDRPLKKRHLGTNWGTPVDISAPGQAVKGAKAAAQNVGQYNSIDGTSFACPLTAGVVVCMLEGYQRPTTRTQVQAIKQKLIDNATAGAIVSAYNFTLPDRLLYLDPNITFETIPGLVPL